MKENNPKLILECLYVIDFLIDNDHRTKLCSTYSERSEMRTQSVSKGEHINDNDILINALRTSLFIIHFTNLT